MVTSAIVFRACWEGHYRRESLVEQSWSPDGRQRGAETQGQALVIVSLCFLRLDSLLEVSITSQWFHQIMDSSVIHPLIRSEPPWSIHLVMIGLPAGDKPSTCGPFRETLPVHILVVGTGQCIWKRDAKDSDHWIPLLPGWPSQVVWPQFLYL